MTKIYVAVESRSACSRHLIVLKDKHGSATAPSLWCVHASTSLFESNKEGRLIFLFEVASHRGGDTLAWLRGCEAIILAWLRGCQEFRWLEFFWLGVLSEFAWLSPSCLAKPDQRDQPGVTLAWLKGSEGLSRPHASHGCHSPIQSGSRAKGFEAGARNRWRRFAYREARA
jgi:hypothetical protein